MWIDREGAMRRTVIVLVISFLLIAAVYRKTPMNFLRAESGWFLFHANSDPETQRHFLTNFFRSSYGGHYTPLAFAAEFQTAKIAGTNESVWKWRQILALAFVAVALAGAIYHIGGVFYLSSFGRWAIAAAVTAGAVFRPEMIEIVNWPFMILQLVLIGLFVLALHSVVRVIASPERRRWPWIAAGAAYGSMHVSGLGVAAVAAVAVVFGSVLLVAARSPSVLQQVNRKRIASALTVMLCLALAHGVAMLYLVQTGAPRLLSAGPFCKLLLGFTAHLAANAVRTFWGTAISEASSPTIASSWPYGLLVIVGAVVLLVELLRRALKDPTPAKLTRFALHSFSVTAFFAFVGLAGARQMASVSLDAAATGFALITSVPRYIVPLHFLVVASAIEIFARLIRRAPRFGSGALCALALAALATQLDYRWNGFPYVAPLTRISHASAWDLIVATVRECRAAELPVPNLPLGALTQEFSDWDPRMFEPVVRRKLKLGPDEPLRLISWNDYLKSEREAYRKKCPSLRLLEEKLGLRED